MFIDMEVNIALMTADGILPGTWNSPLSGKNLGNTLELFPFCPPGGIDWTAYCHVLQRYDIKKARPCLPVMRGSVFCGNHLKKENGAI